MDIEARVWVLRLKKRKGKCTFNSYKIIIKLSLSNGSDRVPSIYYVRNRVSGSRKWPVLLTYVVGGSEKVQNYANVIHIYGWSLIHDYFPFSMKPPKFI